MASATVSTEIAGGTVQGIVGAHTVNIENFTLYAAAQLQTKPPRDTEDRVPAPHCPYPGLAYFGPQDSALFFGRERAIERLTEGIDRQSLTALVGASGSGKSSVVLAGLAPRLNARGNWRFTHFRVGNEPDKNPFRAVARALVPLFSDAPGQMPRFTEIDALAGNLEKGWDTGGVTLPNVLGECRVRNPSRRILIIADQFEEVFTFIEDGQRRQRFIDMLLSGFLGHSDRNIPQICLVLTLRADFYGAALRHRPLADALQGHVENLGPMSRDELREAIVNPAGTVSFESGLVETLLDEVTSRPGSLPLMQFALREMWSLQRRSCITREDYDSIGGVQGALARRAQSIFDAQTGKGQNNQAVKLYQRLFLRMVTLGEGAQDTRRVVGRQELGEAAWALAQQLADEDNRLVVTNAPISAPDQRTGELVREETAEVMHEALIRNWPTLADWITRDRAFLSWLRQLKLRVDEWRGNSTDGDTLLRGTPLALAEDWLARRQEDLSDDERAYILAGIARRQAERRKEDEHREAELRRQQQLAEAAERLAEEQRLRAETAEAAQQAVARTGRLQRRIAFGLTAFAAVLLLGLAIGVWQQVRLNARQLAVDEARVNLLAKLAAVEQFHGNIDGALRLAVDGARRGLNLDSGAAHTSPADLELAAAVAQSDWRVVLSGHQKSLSHADFNSNASLVVTASADKTARIWDATTGFEIGRLSGHSLELYSAEFSPDGSRIVTASADKTARIWDTTTATEIMVLRGHEDSVYSAIFSPDGSRVVTASADRTARIWDAETGKEIAVLRGHKNAIYSAAFSPDGSRIVTASSDKTARIWDTATATEIVVLRGHDGSVLTGAFSPDGSRAVTGSRDKTARIWDITTGAQLSELRGHEDAISSAAFSPDGSRVLTGSGDRTARVWDAATATEILVLRGPSGGVSFANFSSDGSRVVTASEDKTARIWDVTTEVAVLRGHKGPVWFVDYSSDGSHIVTASDDGTARVWDPWTTQQISVLHAGTDWLSSARFSPDGRRIVTASYNGSAEVWDVVSGVKIETLRGHKGEVWSAAYSPDGSRIVTASQDKTARIWDSVKATQVAVLGGHEEQVFSAVFSPDGSRIVTASADMTVRIWEVLTGKQIAVLRGHEDVVTCAAFSPDGSRIVTASWDKTARIWDVMTGTELAVLRGHEREVYCAAYSPDGSRIVTTSYDQTARIWDAATAQEIAVLRGHEDEVVSAAYSPDGARIITASVDKTARIWDARFPKMSTTELLAEVCKRRLRALGTLTRDEMRLAGYSDATPEIDVCSGVR
jgi:WD40 repeat protein